MPNYVIEKAKSGRAKCKRCKETIAKDEPRIGTVTEIEEHASTSWYHIMCSPVPRDVSQRDDPSFIQGWDDIDEEVQEDVKKHYKEGLKVKTVKKDAKKEVGKKHKKSKKDDEDDEEEDEEEEEDQKKKKKGKKKARKEESEEEEEAEEVDEAVEAKKLELKKKTIPQLKEICRDHGMAVGGQKDELLTRVADGMIHGVVPKCPACGAGFLKYDKKKKQWKCPGFHDDSHFNRCGNVVKPDDLQRIPWEEAVVGGVPVENKPAKGGKEEEAEGEAEDE